MSHFTPPPPPLLLTKRVTSFLHANLSSNLIHTAALTTQSGKLIAHASLSLPARVLRRQCAVAASLWAIHGADPDLSSVAEQALPHEAQSQAARSGGEHGAKAVTVQLDGGAVFVIRGLNCGILFVAIGGTLSDGSSRGDGAAEGAAAGGAAQAETGQGGAQSNGAAAMEDATSPSPASPSEAESAATTGGGSSVTSQVTSSTVGGGGSGGVGTGGSSSGGSSSSALVKGTRRQAEELAKWLDDKLGSLSVPEETTAMVWDTR